MENHDQHPPQAQPAPAGPPTVSETAAWAALMDAHRRLAAARAAWLSARATWEDTYVDMIMTGPAPTAPTETAAPRELAGVAS